MRLAALLLVIPTAAYADRVAPPSAGIGRGGIGRITISC